jgi:hypothetical protein
MYDFNPFELASGHTHFKTVIQKCLAAVARLVEDERFSWVTLLAENKESVHILVGPLRMFFREAYDFKLGYVQFGYVAQHADGSRAELVVGEWKIGYASGYLDAFTRDEGMRFVMEAINQIGNRIAEDHSDIVRFRNGFVLLSADQSLQTPSGE